MKTLFFAAALFLAFALNAQSPAGVPIPQEPHHHLVLENEYVRVFRVSVPAHESTLLHQHDVPYLYVSLGPADVINAVQNKPEVHLTMADGQLGYSPGHFAHIARNQSAAPFDNVTIELLKPQGEPRNLCAKVAPNAASVGCDKTLGSDSQKGEFSIEPQLETDEMSSDTLRLGPEMKSPQLSVQAGSLLVALNDSEIQVEVQGKPMRVLHGGEIIWIGTGSRGFISNRSQKPAGCLKLTFKSVSARVSH
jgi:hypothetical protein